ncbi:hypothetical protein LSE82_005587 [Salmonella enterica]|nr:hypothetical protein [Salmonella enterica]
MDGFAEGLLAGFSTVDNAMQNRKALSLREAALAQQQKNADRNYELAQDEFGYRKETDNRDYQHTLDRDKVGDEHWGKDFGLRQAETGARIGMERQRLGMQKEEHDFMMNNARQQQVEQQYAPLVSAGEERLNAGDIDGFLEVMRGVPDQIPLARIAHNHDYAQATVAAGQKLYNFMSSPEAHKDPMATLHNINENMSDMAPLFQTEADRAVGQVDPKTGQKIVSAQVHHIAPVPDKNDPEHHSPDDVALFLKVKYANGKEAIKPVTENRSSDLRDNVKRVSIHGLLDTSSSRVSASHKFLQLLIQKQGLTQRDIDKGAIQVTAGAARGGQPVDTAVDNYKAAMGDSGAKQRVQQKQATDTAKTWAGDDPVKKEFASVMLRNNPAVFIPGNEDDLRKSYQNFIDRNTSTQNELKDASASGTAKYLRQRREQQQQSDFIYGSD